MRNELERIISHWMEADENVLFLAADIGGGLYKKLAGKFPGRAVNVGIAEQNMIGMAAGLTDMGFRAICYSKACFVSLKVADQIKNALCYARKNVLLIAADAGYDEANAGHPHISMEDLGIVQSFPELDIYMPSTVHSLHSMFERLKDSNKPAYLRMNKQKVEEETLELLDVGFALYYMKKAEHPQMLILAYGCSAIEAMRMAEGDSAISILAVDSLSIDDNFLMKEILKYRKVLVLEEQFEGNGLYSYLCRMLVRHHVSDIALERLGPSFEYRGYCFDRETALMEERRQYEKGYGRHESGKAADGKNALGR